MSESIARRAQLTNDLAAQLVYWDIKRQVKNEIIKPQYKSKDVATLIPKVMEEMGLTTKLRNAIYEIYHRKYSTSNSKTSASATSSDPTSLKNDRSDVVSVARAGGNEEFGFDQEENELDTVNEARRQWEEGICEELNALGLEQQRPLARLRNDVSAGERARTFAEKGADPTQQNTRRFLFDSEDLLEAIASIDSPNHSSNVTRIQSWGMVRVLLKTPDVNELRSIFSELHPSMSQIGLDDALEGNEKWLEERCELGEKILSAGYIAVIRQYAKRGVPSGLRSKMWKKMLNLELDQAARNYFDVLQTQVGTVDILVDQLFHMDVEHAIDDDSYFPFDQELDDTVMAFSRDPWVLKNCANRVHPPLVGRTADGHTVGVFPPCGVQPFRGLVSYAAPLCFIYHEHYEIYFVFREMFSQLWCKLNSINSERSCIVMLSKLFEVLVQRYEPELFRHLLDVGIAPLALAFSWIQLGFVGYLQSDQLLLLWDRILAQGKDGLLLLPVLAASIFVYRSHNLMKTRDVQDVKDILGDPSQLLVVPLLQHFLFSV
jgi:hypothetical protein